MTSAGREKDLRHFHDGVLHWHPDGDTPHQHSGPVYPAAAPEKRHSGPDHPIIVGLVILAVIYVVIFHVGYALVTKSAPPASCQLLGGQWSIWSGWRCG